jgi:hypothetical protein
MGHKYVSLRLSKTKAAVKDVEAGFWTIGRISVLFCTLSVVIGGVVAAVLLSSSSSSSPSNVTVTINQPPPNTVASTGLATSAQVIYSVASLIPQIGVFQWPVNNVGLFQPGSVITITCAPAGVDIQAFVIDTDSSTITGPSITVYNQVIDGPPLTRPVLPWVFTTFVAPSSSSGQLTTHHVLSRPLHPGAPGYASGTLQARESRPASCSFMRTELQAVLRVPTLASTLHH